METVIFGILDPYVSQHSSFKRSIYSKEKDSNIKTMMHKKCTTIGFLIEKVEAKSRRIME
jgi:hypothetical protein